MYGLSDQPKGMPRTRLRALRHGSSRYSTRMRASIEHTFVSRGGVLDTPMELPGGIRRITCELPTRPGHVHTYLLPGDDGWTLVDTGLGLPDAAERWAAELAGVPGEVARILITHFHPDHVGAAADVAALTGAPVHQGTLDYEQCSRVWARPRLAAAHRGLVHRATACRGRAPKS